MTTNNGGKVVKPILESRIIGQSLKKVSIAISAQLWDPDPVFWPFHLIKSKMRRLFNPVLVNSSTEPKVIGLND